MEVRGAKPLIAKWWCGHMEKLSLILWGLWLPTWDIQSCVFLWCREISWVRHTLFRYLLTCTNSWPFNFHWQWLDCIDFQSFQTLMCRQWQFKIIVKHALWAIVRRMIISQHVIMNTMQNVFYLRKCSLQCWRGEKNWNNVTNKYHSCMEGSYSSCFELRFQYGMEF